VGSGRHGDTGAALVEQLRLLGAKAEFICANVRHDEEMRSLIAIASALTARPDHGPWWGA